MSRHEYFKKRLKDLGMYDKDSDYDGEIGKCIEKMSASFAEYGHSGESARLTMDLFNNLMDEWNRQDLK